MSNFDISGFIENIWTSLQSIDWEKIPIVDRDLTIYDFIVTALGLYFGWKAIRLAKASLRHSREPDSKLGQKLNVKIYGIVPEEEFVLFAPFEEVQIGGNPKRKIVFPISFTIENLDETSADGVLLYMKINSDLYKSYALSRRPGPIASASGIVVASEKQGNDEIVTVLWNIGHIAPKTAIEIRDHIVCSSPSQELDWSVPISLSDGVDGEVRGQFSIVFALNVTVTARNRESSVEETSLAFRKSFAGEIRSYLQDRIDADGKVNKLDQGRKAYVTFASFKKGDLDEQFKDGLKKSVGEKDAQYQEFITESVPSRFETEAQARKFLLNGIDGEILEADGFRVLIAEGRRSNT